MTTARAARIRTRVAVIAASLVTLNSIVVLIGWAAGWSIFLTPSPDFIPMAPTTALAFLALSAALGARMLAPRGSAVRNAGTALGWLVASMAIVNIVVPTLLDQALGGSTGQVGRVPLGAMSPAPPRAALGWLVASMAIVNIVVPTLLDQALGGSTGQFGRVPLGVMSPVTAAALT